MAQRLVFIADSNYATQATVTAQLATLHSSNPISLLITHDDTIPNQWAAAWALSNGVPWVTRASYLDGCGYVEPFSRALAVMQVSSPQAVLAAGTGAHPSAAAAVATSRGHTLTKI